MPQKISCTVNHIARCSIDWTESLVRSLVPRSPCTASPSQRPNWVVTGSSRWNDARHRETAVTSLLARARAHGSKLARTNQNSRKAAIRITGMEYSVLRVMYVSISVPRPRPRPPACDPGSAP